MVSHRAFAKFWPDKRQAQLWARASEPKLGLILAPVGSNFASKFLHFFAFFPVKHEIKKKFSFGKVFYVFQ